MAFLPTSFQQPRNINTMELTLPVRPSITNTHLTKLDSFRSTQPSVRRKILQYCIGHNERKRKFSMVLPPQLDNNQVMRFVRKKKYREGCVKLKNYQRIILYSQIKGDTTPWCLFSAPSSLRPRSCYLSVGVSSPVACRWSGGVGRRPSAS